MPIASQHGRNAATWNVKGEQVAASDRFNYDYPPEQIDELAGRIASPARLVPETPVVFNNKMEDQGQRNARSLIEALRAARAPA